MIRGHCENNGLVDTLRWVSNGFVREMEKKKKKELKRTDLKLQIGRSSQFINFMLPLRKLNMTYN